MPLELRLTRTPVAADDRVPAPESKADESAEHLDLAATATDAGGRPADHLVGHEVRLLAGARPTGGVLAVAFLVAR